VRYSIDTSSLINGFRDNYPYLNFPRLWNEDLPTLVASGDLRASEEVLFELRRQDDELIQWITDYGDELFVEVDEVIQHEVRAILRSHTALVHAGRGRSGADPFVVALAKINVCTVVTEEGRGSARHPKIPDVCEALGVPCIRLVDLIGEQGWVYG
jgi:Domain of unknown function (DUF4411)